MLQKQCFLKVITLISKALTHDQYLPLLLTKDAYIIYLKKNSCKAQLSSRICHTDIQSREMILQYPSLRAIRSILSDPSTETIIRSPVSVFLMPLPFHLNLTL